MNNNYKRLTDAVAEQMADEGATLAEAASRDSFHGREGALQRLQLLHGLLAEPVLLLDICQKLFPEEKEE